MAIAQHPPAAPSTAPAAALPATPAAERFVRLAWAVAIVVYLQSMYTFVQRHGSPGDLRLYASIDALVPWVPWTIFVYISVFIVLVGAAWYLDERRFADTFLHIVFAHSLSMLVFWHMSLDYPRPCPRAVTGEFLRWGYMVLNAADHPNNTFPSTHVSLTCIVMHHLWRQGLPGWLCGAYAAIIGLSTLTTKQHFFYDVVGGVAVYLVTLAVLPLVRRIGEAAAARLRRPRGAATMPIHR